MDLLTNGFVAFRILREYFSIVFKPPNWRYCVMATPGDWKRWILSLTHTHTHTHTHTPQETGKDGYCHSHTHTHPPGDWERWILSLTHTHTKCVLPHIVTHTHTHTHTQSVCSLTSYPPWHHTLITGLEFTIPGQVYT